MSNLDSLIVLACISTVSLTVAQIILTSFLKRLDKQNDRLRDEVRTIKNAEQQLRHTLDRYELAGQQIRTNDLKNSKDPKEMVSKPTKDYLTRIDAQMEIERQRDIERLVRAAQTPVEERRRGDHIRSTFMPAENIVKHDKKPGI